MNGLVLLLVSSWGSDNVIVSRYALVTTTQSEAGLERPTVGGGRIISAIL